MTRTQALSDAYTQLENLGAALERRGWIVRITGEGSGSRLTVTNPDAAGLSETIHCIRAGAAWNLMWSWREAIGPANDPGGAVRKICQVLRADGSR